MSSAELAILVDGGYARPHLKRLLGVREIQAGHIVTLCSWLAERASAGTGVRYRIFRVFYYDSPPSAETIVNPLSKEATDLSRSPLFRQGARLLDQLEQRPFVAVRRGDLAMRGWKIGERALKSLLEEPRVLEAQDLVPNLQQKGVDLRIGLDLVSLASIGRAHGALVVAGDADLVPAFKQARRAGLCVYVATLGNHGVRSELVAHNDLTIRDLPDQATRDHWLGETVASRGPSEPT